MPLLQLRLRFCSPDRHLISAEAIISLRTVNQAHDNSLVEEENKTSSGNRRNLTMLTPMVLHVPEHFIAITAHY